MKEYIEGQSLSRNLKEAIAVIAKKKTTKELHRF